MPDFIYNQTQIPKDRWRYGLRSSAATGCGWIAVHNALQLLGCSAKPEALIRYFRRKQPLLNGNFGTLVFHLSGFFKKQGFPVSLSLRRRNFDALAKSSDACILFYHWRKKLRLGSHFAAFRYEGGRFEGYNTFRNSSGPDGYGPSLEAFLQKQKFFWPMLITIRKRPKKERP